MRISVRRSWLPAIISAEDKETRFISKNFGFMITTTEFGVNFFLSNRPMSFSYKDSNFIINPDPRKQSNPKPEIWTIYNQLKVKTHIPKKIFSFIYELFQAGGNLAS